MSGIPPSRRWRDVLVSVFGENGNETVRMRRIGFDGLTEWLQTEGGCGRSAIRDEFEDLG